MALPTYSRGAIAFHWIIALLIILNIVGGFFAEFFGDAAAGAIMSLHKATGILVLALTLGRIGWRLTHRPPPLPATVRPWERGVAHAVHAILYLLMLALPVTGWLMVSMGSRRNPIDFYGLFTVPWLPVAQDRAAAGVLGERHEMLGILAALLIAVHVAAALKHHVLDRDGTLVRMLPMLGRARQG